MHSVGILSNGKADIDFVEGNQLATKSKVIARLPHEFDVDVSSAVEVVYLDHFVDLNLRVFLQPMATELAGHQFRPQLKDEPKVRAG